MRRHQRRRGEQLGVVNDTAIRDERHPGLFLPRRALDVGDVDIAGLRSSVEAGKAAGLGRPGQYQVVTGHRPAVGIDGVVGDLVVEDQRRPLHHRDRSEVAVSHHLAVGAVIAKPGESPGECLRPGRRGTDDGIGVVGDQRAVDHVVDLSRGAARTRGQRGCGDQRRGTNDSQAGDARMTPAAGATAPTADRRSACRSDAWYRRDALGAPPAPACWSPGPPAGRIGCWPA